MTDGVAHVTVRHQRLPWRLVEELVSLMDQLAVCEDVRVGLLASEHPDFSHGADLSDQALLAAVGVDGGRSVAETGARLITGLTRLPFPTIAVVDGYVIGGGACLAFACDFRIATPGARISFPEIDRGMHLSWDIIPRLLSECGVTMTRRLTLLGEEISAGDFPAGSFTLSDDPHTTGAELAQKLAHKPATAARLIKEAIIAATPQPVGTRTDAQRFVESLQSQEFAAVISSWLDRET
jgi:enoyl-CoA hydratase